MVSRDSSHPGREAVKQPKANTTSVFDCCYGILTLECCVYFSPDITGPIILICMSNVNPQILGKHNSFSKIELSNRSPRWFLPCCSISHIFSPAVQVLTSTLAQTTELQFCVCFSTPGKIYGSKCFRVLKLCGPVEPQWRAL